MLRIRSLNCLKQFTKMDLDSSAVMKPKLIRIGDSCYRRMDMKADDNIFVYRNLHHDKNLKNLQNKQQPGKSIFISH